MLNVRLLSSLHTVFPDQCEKPVITGFSALKNEPFSFQIAYRLEDEENMTRRILLQIECALPIAVYLVGYVPVKHTQLPDLEDFPAPGLYGDMLLPKKVNPPLVYDGGPWGKNYYEENEPNLINAASDCWQSLWLEINEEQRSLDAGNYPVKIRFLSCTDLEVIGEACFTFRIIDAELPPQKLIYTNWFHYDCLSDWYNEPVFTERYFEILRNHIRQAARNGMNMLLLPAFTPPLDTPIGTRRKKVQLVHAEYSQGEWRFDFTLLKRFLDLCREEGIEYFEHSHFFTQWGAASAPAVYAETDGQEKCVFDWNTSADGAEYSAFLRSYLKAVLPFFEREGLKGKVLFHVSDEPSENNIAAYTKARAVIFGLLKDWMIGDALSHYALYEKGLVDLPICVTSQIEDFIGRCDHLWAYYTGGQLKNGLSNRLLALPYERNRILGVQMYANHIEGFLHWGYNYYYDQLSHGFFDPAINPCGYNNRAGTSFCVYPARNGECIQSIRQKVFHEGIIDMRALEALETKKGREVCEKIIREFFGKATFHTCPESPEQLLAFRDKVNCTLDGE